jgi:glycosyltransferase involved in cell wall biosynthesis
MTDRNAPRVSVLMSVRDGMPWLEGAIASILGQTLADLELIVLDDGSRDGTGRFLGSLRDPRLRVLHQSPVGLTASLNRALARSKASLIARLDADDFAVPERLARQVAFLDSHPDVGVLGSAAREVDPQGRELDIVRPPLDDGAIRRTLIRRNPFVHSTVVVRRAVLDRSGGYDERLAVAQDYDLWMRLAPLTTLANLPDALVIRRLLPGRVSATRDGERLRTEARVRWRAVGRGDYPWWCAVYAARPALALALPSPLRRLIRGMRW